MSTDSGKKIVGVIGGLIVALLAIFPARFVSVQVAHAMYEGGGEQEKANAAVVGGILGFITWIGIILLARLIARKMRQQSLS